MARKKLGQEVSKQDILAAALKYFSAYGYKSTNMKDIAKSLNCTRTPIYYYFNDKKMLYEEVVRDHMRYKQEKYTRLFSSDAPFFEKVHEDLLLSSHHRMEEENLFVDIEIHPDLKEAKKIQDDVMREIHCMKIRNIKKAIDDGILRRDTDPEQFMVYFYVISFGIEAVHKQMDYEMTEERISRLIDTVMDGIIYRYKEIRY